MSNSERLLRLVAMKLLWPRGPGPGLYRTELHLNDALERTLALYGIVKADVESVMEVVYPPNSDPDLCVCGSRRNEHMHSEDPNNCFTHPFTAMLPTLPR